MERGSGRERIIDLGSALLNKIVNILLLSPFFRTSLLNRFHSVLELHTQIYAGNEYERTLSILQQWCEENPDGATIPRLTTVLRAQSLKNTADEIESIVSSNQGERGLRRRSSTPMSSSSNAGPTILNIPEEGQQYTNFNYNDDSTHYSDEIIIEAQEIFPHDLKRLCEDNRENITKIELRNVKFICWPFWKIQLPQLREFRFIDEDDVHGISRMSDKEQNQCIRYLLFCVMSPEDFEPELFTKLFTNFQIVIGKLDISERFKESDVWRQIRRKNAQFIGNSEKFRKAYESGKAVKDLKVVHIDFTSLENLEQFTERNYFMPNLSQLCLELKPETPIKPMDFEDNELMWNAFQHFQKLENKNLQLKSIWSNQIDVELIFDGVTLLKVNHKLKELVVHNKGVYLTCLQKALENGFQRYTIAYGRLSTAFFSKPDIVEQLTIYNSKPENSFQFASKLQKFQNLTELTISNGQGQLLDLNKDLIELPELRRVMVTSFNLKCTPCTSQKFQTKLKELYIWDCRFDELGFHNNICDLHDQLEKVALILQKDESSQLIHSMLTAVAKKLKLIKSITLGPMNWQAVPAQPEWIDLNLGLREQEYFNAEKKGCHWRVTEIIPRSYQYWNILYKLGQRHNIFNNMSTYEKYSK